jgi:hypothetical protein
MNATKHIVSEMDEHKVQRCILCGKTILDLNGTSSTGGFNNGYAPGEIYVWGTNPENTSTTPPRYITINHCSK